jgi:hypothetical protein
VKVKPAHPVIGVAISSSWSLAVSVFDLFTPLH